MRQWNSCDADSRLQLNGIDGGLLLVRVLLCAAIKREERGRLSTSSASSVLALVTTNNASSYPPTSPWGLVRRPSRVYDVKSQARSEPYVKISYIRHYVT